MYEASFDPGRLLTRTSAAYKGIYALLMAKGCKDWYFDQDITLANHYDLAVDIHHVFPKAGATPTASTISAGRASSTRLRFRPRPTGM